MSREWKEVTLQSVTSKIGSGSTPKGGKESYKKNGISLIRSQNVLDFIFSSNGLAFIDEDQASKLKNVIIEKDDVLVNITGDSVARVCSVPDKYIPARVNQHVAILRVDKRLLSSQFLKYSLLNPINKKRLLNLASSGATRNALTKGMLETFYINLPPLPEQKAIAHILGKLDDKIELNRKMNESLEAMAQALFKSWFVDFDPVIDNALLAGNEIPEALQAKVDKRLNIQARQGLKRDERFPDRFVYEEELGKYIPLGWEVRKAEHVFTINIGKTPPRKEKQWFRSKKDDSNCVWVSIKNMGSCGVYISDSDEYLTNEAIDKFNVKVVPKGAVLLSFKLTVGRVAISTQEMCTNEAIAHFTKPKFGITSSYIYSYLKNFDFDNLGSTSSIATAVNSKVIKGMPILLPFEETLREFMNITESKFKKIYFIKTQTETLTKLRDTLLPQLISGKLKVPEAMLAVEQELEKGE